MEGRGTRWIAAAAVAAALAAGAAPAAMAATFTVTGTADSTSPCAGTVCPSLRAAVTAANASPGSTIQLGGGTYRLGLAPNQPVDIGELKITTTMTIAGAGANATTIQQVDAKHRVIEIAAGTATLSGLTVTGGSLTGAVGSLAQSKPGETVDGGGIVNDHGATLTLDGVTVTGNSLTGGNGDGEQNGGTAAGAAFGGGVASAGSLTVVGSTISGNFATGGAGGGCGTSGGSGGRGGDAAGGLYVDPSSAGTTLVRDSAISGDKATAGQGGGGGCPASAGGDATGGILARASLSLDDSSVTGNIATGGAGAPGTTDSGGGNADGGAVAATGGTLTIVGSTLAGNIATGGKGGDGGPSPAGGGSGLGGGLFTDVQGTVVNSTITGNTVAGGAGGSNGGNQTGTTGNGNGGGIDDAAGSTATLTLASVTLAANTASTVGGDVSRGITSLAARDTIFAGGTAPAGSTCSATAVSADGGHNLDSSSPPQCGLSSANADVLGTDPLLQTLADNGGPTPTMALAPTSPARGAGGTCTDPLAGNGPLATDQRGLPRPTPCDIGAFQTHPPAGAGAPQITGSAVVGRVLSCSQGSWTGDPTLSFAYAWLRDGAPIAGAQSAQYTVGADAGHRLVCQVTATNQYGSAAQQSAEVVATSPSGGGGAGSHRDTTPPRLTGLAIAPATFAVAPGPTPVSGAAKLARGTSIRFRVSETARVTLSIQRPLAGIRIRRRGRRVCVRASSLPRARRHGPRCTVYAGAGALRRTVKPGLHRVRFTGRLGSTALPLGRYRLQVVAIDAAGNRSKPAFAAFRIVRPPRHHRR